ncbi:MAG: DUF1385 domain-containing protein [Lachnospiraceae bacterium]|nr:DUF1385 domain-containing protein [Lachnospiraceae bacterium]
MKASGIGGQAVMEGVMMKNGDNYAVAVRKNDEEIVVEKREHVSLTKRVKFFGLPVIRGVIIFGESMFVGVKTLTYSARIYEEETEGEAAKQATVKDKTKEDIVMAGTVVLSILIAVGLFMLLPFFAATLIKDVIKSEFLQALIEGIIRVTLFVAYIAAISLMKDIKRVFMYHGAEHKSINCVENGLPLTVENVRAQSREHKRCGTSFMLYVMVLSVLFFMCIRVDNFWLRIVFRLLLIPVIAGLSYEFIRLAGRTTNPVITALSKPGLLLQKLTTREPDDSMIEVAITSVEAVFDWKEFLEKFDSKEEPPCKKQKTKAKKAPKEKPAPVDEDETVVANVRVGGITDPIEDLDDDFDIIPEIEDKKETASVEAVAEEAETEETVEAAEEELEAEAAGEESEAETEEEPEAEAEEATEAETEAEAEEATEAETEAEAEEATGAEAEEAAEEEAEKPEEKSEEAEDKAEDKPEEKAEDKAEEKSEKTEEKAEDKTSDKSEDEDHLGFFKGRRSTGKNTGLDSAPEPTKGVNHRAPVEIEKRAVPEEDDEDDEVLKKLDRFFVNKNKKDKEK